MLIIDSHAHLMFSKFDEDIDDVLKRADQAGVKQIVNVGFNQESSRQAIELAEKYEQCYATVGIHPHDATLDDSSFIGEWGQMISTNEKIIAIGECGLDYFKSKIPKKVQKGSFKLQLELAARVGLPVIIHNRDSDEDCLRILDEVSTQVGDKLKVVFHCYGSDLDFAKNLWDRGHMTSFTGTVTYPNAQELKEVAREVPMDKFMVETDCPYLAPQKYRGKRNEPSYVVEVVREIAKLKNLSFKEVANASTENAKRFFKRLGLS